MPKSFLVKRRVSTRLASRDWGELSDQLRGDLYIPEGSVAQTLADPRLLAGGSVSVWERTHAGNFLQGVTQSPCPPQLGPGNSKGRSPAAPQFQCCVCSKHFPLQRMLNRHLKCHSSVKKHVCRYCGKGFNDTFDLKRHLRTHTGIRPYRCCVCDKAFTQRCSLESHLKKIHSIQQRYAYRERRSKLFVCEECGFTCSGSEEYYGHVRRLHPAHGILARGFQKVALADLHPRFHVLYPSGY
ncbi:putative transcription factor ovo-like protein 3 [Podarcis raffonei]|uniref:putative transcription factor ovo-like protein 3 n=1 Tax=Podarcis raffonei TaxID=65483 RepID=UPI002329175E|nr:putative transcription factor ovo-like protein 3 [Podarcis raffonei]